MPKIGIDHDDTIVELYRAAVPHLNKVFNTSHTAEKLTTYWLEDVWGCTSEEMARHFNEFIHGDSYQNIAFVPGAIEALHELKGYSELILITNRWESLRAPTMSVLERHVPGVFSESYFLGTGRVGQETHTTKGKLASELGLAVVVDDSLENASLISAEGIPVVMLDRPWNQGETNKLVQRVADWEEALNSLRNILNV